MTVFSGWSVGRQVALTTLLLHLCLDTHAQDSHYATHTFGTRASLMSGAVIGYARDNSSIYYNAGSLAFLDSNSITLTANMYQIEQIRIASPYPGQSEVAGTKINSVPLMVGGMLGRGKSRLKIGYGVISPTSFDFRINRRTEGIFPMVDDAESPGNEVFTGEVSRYSRLSEVQGILAIGYRWSEHWGVGLSSFAIGRNQEYGKTTRARLELNDPSKTLSEYSLSRNAEYFHLRYTAKAGISYRETRFAAGFTIQAPSLSVGGNGKSSAEITGNELLVLGIRSRVAGYTLQEKLRPSYKTPLAFSAGCNWTYRRFTPGFSVEYHTRQKVYTVLDGSAPGFELSVGLPGGLNTRDLTRIRSGTRSVTNFAFAVDYVVQKNLHLVASVRSNLSWYDHNLDRLNSLQTEISTWNLYHARLGVTIKQGHSQLTCGFLYGTGTDPSRPSLDEFGPTRESEFLSPVLNHSRARYQSFGFLLGYSFMLFDL